jgi:hypothetical protein
LGRKGKEWSSFPGRTILERASPPEGILYYRAIETSRLGGWVGRITRRASAIREAPAGEAVDTEGDVMRRGVIGGDIYL